MRDWIDRPGIYISCLIYWTLFCIFMLSGCVGELFEFKGATKEPVRINVSGSVMDEQTQTAIPNAVIGFYRRTTNEDWVMGGYDYESLGSVTADTNGNYFASRILTDCGTWSYYVEASLHTDTLAYYSKDHYLGCTTGSYTVDLLVNPYAVPQ